MEINVADYEKLGAFYLGREYNQRQKTMEDKLVMYDSKDLVTHGVVLGMTGSGKTGLCFALLEEAAMDGVPAIVIDPKGDITNFCLTFPNLEGKEFEPWVNEEDAKKKGKTLAEFAQGQADAWKKGLADWGQSEERIRTLRSKVDTTIFTPGSNAGIPVSILSSMQCPPQEILDDEEILGERIESTVSSILGLVGVDADPIKDPEHILLSNILHHCWTDGENLDLARIIEYIQQPPFETIGVIEVDEFFAPKKRSELAMSINALLASPGFSMWMTGEPLDIQRLLYTPEGKPRISIFSIGHLNDSERMFFVSLLLNQMVGWMRGQSGTTSLRALLYMDEIYGYLPPTQNPPSKKPMMLLLKQARAFGIGCLLATQNPVDLDYKALSNIGTWWLGRLQTERDKARVLDGLEGAASSQNSNFDRNSMDTMLAGLGNRVFLMNNTHEDGPVVFQVRWVMTYLRGPLTRNQIKGLMDPQRKEYAAPAGSKKKKATKKGTKPAAVAETDTEAEEAGETVSRRADGSPDLPRTVEQYYFPVNETGKDKAITYMPAVMTASQIQFNDAKNDIFVKRQVMVLNKLTGDSMSVNLDEGERVDLDVDALSREAASEEAEFGDLPDMSKQSKTYTNARDSFVEWAYAKVTLDLRYCGLVDETSQPGEDEGDFRARLLHKVREIRDAKVEEIRAKYGKKIADLDDDMQRAHAMLEKQKAEARSAKVSTAVSIGQTILGVLFGGGRKSSAISKGATAMKGASKAWAQSGDVAGAEARLAAVEQEIADLQAQAEADIEEIRRQTSLSEIEFETINIRPLKKNILVEAHGLAWLPYADHNGSLKAAWQIEEA
jgi:hypothetical protein